MNMLYKILTFVFILALGIAPTSAQQTIGSGHVLGNGTSAARTPTDTALHAIMGQSGSGLGAGVSTALGNPTNGLGGVSTWLTKPSNAALSALPSTALAVTRTGVAAAGDSPPVNFVASGSACSLNAGAGDVGSQVPTSDGKCWLAAPVVLNPMDFGAAGNGSTDDSVPLAATFAAAPAYSSVDLSGHTYMLTATIPRPAVGVAVHGGTLYLNNPTPEFLYTIVASDYMEFDHVNFLGTGAVGTAITPKYQGGIFGGNSIYPAPMNVPGANYVYVHDCSFSELTVGVWSGPASTDPTPVGWTVVNNKLLNIVGFQAQSEGYGVLFTPSSDGVISGNTFTNIHRHAVYLAGGAQNVVVSNNVVDGVDNIAIQTNASHTQPLQYNINISNNVIRNLTKSFAYGYASSIGIGLFGDYDDVVVANNVIYQPLDIGIYAEAEAASGGVAYSTKIKISGNQVIGGTGASAISDSGIKVTDTDGVTISDNMVSLASAANAITYETTSALAVNPAVITGNQLSTTNASAIAFRTDLTTASLLQIYNNYLAGFTFGTGTITDSSTTAIIKTDLNNSVGYYATDADLTYEAGSLGGQNAPVVRWAASQGADRNVFLDCANVPSGSTATVINLSSGGKNLLIHSCTSTESGYALLRTSTATNTGKYGWNGTTWEEISYAPQ
jgi:Right handed beta helix region